MSCRSVCPGPLLGSTERRSRLLAHRSRHYRPPRRRPLEAGEPVILLGDSGTELVEAADERTPSRVRSRYGRLDLLYRNKLGYVHIDPRRAELLFMEVRHYSDTEVAHLKDLIGSGEPIRLIAQASNGPWYGFNEVEALVLAVRALYRTQASGLAL